MRRRTNCCTSWASDWKKVLVVRAATRTGGDHRSKGPQAHALQQLLRDYHFVRARLVGFRGQRNADGIAYSLLQQDCHGGG